MIYVAWLRGINVGGNSLVKMSALISIFEKLGYQHVSTYINSGNVLFVTNITSPRKLENTIEQALHNNLKLPIKVAVRSFTEMQNVIKHLPKSWKKPEDKKCNVIFLRPSINKKSILKKFKPKPDIEELSYQPGVLYWSALISGLTKSNMLKLAGDPIYKEVTIRNLNTTKKVFALMSALKSKS